MKKIGLLLATIIMMLLFAFSASALEPSGWLGGKVNYTYDSTTSEVVINGEGAMRDYSYDESPFYESEIKSVIINQFKLFCQFTTQSTQHRPYNLKLVRSKEQ